MKKLISIIKEILRGFLKNPFWKSLQIDIVLGLSIALNGLLWYIYETKIHQNPVPFIFASGLIFLNLILANYLWNREKLSSLFLLYTGFFIQILMLIFIRYLTLTF